MGSRRVLIIHNILSPYRVHEFEALNREDGVELMVAFLRTGDERRPWQVSPLSLGFSNVVLRPIGKGTPAVAGIVWRERPDLVIVGGWDKPAFLPVYALKGIGRYRLAVWVESTKDDSRQDSGWRAMAKRLLIRRADAVMCPGSASSAYVRELGARRVFVAPNATDNAFFAMGAELARLEDPERAGRPTALYVGRLAREKGVDVLLRAWAEIERDGPLANLIIVGSGPEGERLKTVAASLELTRVEWVPFVQQADLPRWYALADVLVLASRSESWGFVVNEAMATGLPVIASDVVGAGADLIADGVTGFRFPSGDDEALGARLREVLQDSDLCRRMGTSAKSAIAAYTVEHWAGAVTQMIREMTPA